MSVKYRIDETNRVFTESQTFFVDLFPQVSGLERCIRHKGGKPTRLIMDAKMGVPDN